MPRGRQPDHDKRISTLIEQLRSAVIAKEQAELDRRIEARVAMILRGVRATDYARSVRVRLGRVARPKKPRTKTQGPPSAGRLRQIAAMKAYWKKRKAEQATKAGS